MLLPMRDLNCVIRDATDPDRSGRHRDTSRVHLQVVSALPHDAHFMGILMAEISALSTCHPEQNPALAGQNIYQNKEIVDKQICRLIGEFSVLNLECVAGTTEPPLHNAALANTLTAAELTTLTIIESAEVLTLMPLLRACP